MSEETTAPNNALKLVIILCICTTMLSGWGTWKWWQAWNKEPPLPRAPLSQSAALQRERDLLGEPEPPMVAVAQPPGRFRSQAAQALNLRPGELAVMLNGRHGDGEVKYRFVSMPLDELAQMAAEWSGLNYRPNPEVTGVVNRSYDMGDPLQLLAEAAKDAGYNMRMVGKQIVLEKRTADATTPKIYVKAFKKFHPPENLALVGGQPSKGILLSSPENRLEEVLRGLMGPDAFIRYDEKTNLLTALDTEPRLQLLNALLERLDRGQPLLATAISIYEVKIDRFRVINPDWNVALREVGGAKANAESLELINRILSGKDVTGSFVPTSRHGVILPTALMAAALDHVENLNLVTLRSQFFCSTTLDGKVTFTQSRREFFEATSDPPTSAPRIFPLDVSSSLLPGSSVLLRIAPSAATMGLQTRRDQIETVSTRVPLGKSFVLSGVADSLLPGALEWDWNISSAVVETTPPKGGYGMLRDKDLILVAEPILFDPTDGFALQDDIQWLRQTGRRELQGRPDFSAVAGAK